MDEYADVLTLEGRRHPTSPADREEAAPTPALPSPPSGPPAAQSRNSPVLSTDVLNTDETVEVSPAPVRPRIRTRLAGRAPAPPSPGTALHAVSAATAVLLALVAIGSLIHEPVLIPPLAASAAIIHSVPGLPLAQPRSVIAGHLLCTAVGYAVAASLGTTPWAAALAAGIGLAVMTVARTPHSPACATSVVIVLHTPQPASFVPLLVGSTVLLVLAGWALSYARPGAARYPAYWW
ncbi:HPP family protein [Streptomyces formicae]|uniref:HPP family protein n=1 Tax=Streptomyces formicae TaxID=1616117 RepID=UPI001F41A409|nr:HPP family protein [Streptomyces formicae]